MQEKAELERVNGKKKAQKRKYKRKYERKEEI